MYATSHSPPSVKLLDSTVVLSLDAGDATGATVRVMVECSVITQIMQPPLEGEES
jgi:hypothetical protein